MAREKGGGGVRILCMVHHVPHRSYLPSPVFGLAWLRTPLATGDMLGVAFGKRSGAHGTRIVMTTSIMAGVGGLARAPQLQPAAAGATAAAAAECGACGAGLEGGGNGGGGGAGVRCASCGEVVCVECADGAPPPPQGCACAFCACRVSEAPDALCALCRVCHDRRGGDAGTPCAVTSV